MKKPLTGLILALLFLAACNNSQPASETSADTTQLEEEVTVEATESEEDGKPQRLSPFQKASGNIDGIDVEIGYSSPSVKSRKIWENLVPYGEVWRTGANEATTISFSKTVSVEGKTLAAGKYSLFTVPNENKWTVIFNTVAEQWGAYEYDKAKDALRVDVTPETLPEPVETLKFIVENGKVTLQWEKVAVPISIGAPQAG